MAVTFHLGNRLLSFAHNLFNGIKLNDPLTGLRIVRWEIVKNWWPKSKGFDVEVELNHLVENKGFNITEIPIRYRQRLGEKKLKLAHGLVILKRILAESLSPTDKTSNTLSHIEECGTKRAWKTRISFKNLTQLRQRIVRKKNDRNTQVSGKQR